MLDIDLFLPSMFFWATRTLLYWSRVAFCGPGPAGDGVVEKEGGKWAVGPGPHTWLQSEKLCLVCFYILRLPIRFY